MGIFAECGDYDGLCLADLVRKAAIGRRDRSTPPFAPNGI